MSSRCRDLSRVAVLAVIFAGLFAAGCEREMRKLAKSSTPHIQSPGGQKQVEIQPGQAGAGLQETSASRTYDGENAYELSQGKRLFRWYNCSGCHSNGGGGMAPALMDEKWIYGHEPEQIFTTIMDGRPNGMPAFRGRVPEAQAWQLVAYVRSMSGQSSKAAAPNRSDSLSPGKPESRRDRLTPVQTGPQP
jgi:cytochrome c oxidase cbb3-type subunit 3